MRKFEENGALVYYYLGTRPDSPRAEAASKLSAELVNLGLMCQTIHDQALRTPEHVDACLVAARNWCQEHPDQVRALILVLDSATHLDDRIILMLPDNLLVVVVIVGTEITTADNEWLTQLSKLSNFRRYTLGSDSDSEPTTIAQMVEAWRGERIQ